MSFQWPEMLWCLLLVPLLILLYLWLLRRRRKSTVRFASVALVKQAMGSGPTWRRHVPPAVLLLAVTVLIVASARHACAGNKPCWVICCSARAP